jgi:hypothetical protein
MNQPGAIGGPGENDSMTGVEDVMGGHRDDVIVGDAVHNLISGDPQPPIVNVPPDPPLPPGPPGGHFGDDHITTRDEGPDTVDCTSGTADVHVADRLDASINCETVDRPPEPPPPPPAVAPSRGSNEKVVISGPSSAGRVRVGRNGVLRLAGNVITCPRAGGPCAVTTVVRARIKTSVAWASASAKRKGRMQTLRLGSSAYRIKEPASAAGGGFNRGAVRARLSRRALRLLERRKAIRSTVRVTVTWERTTTTRRISVILKPPAGPRRR